MNRRYSPTEKAKMKKRVIIISLIAVVLIAAAFLLLRGCNDTDSVENPMEVPVYLEDEGSSIEGAAQEKEREDIMGEIEKQQLVVTDKLSSNITFASGEIGIVGEWVVENPAENSIIQQAEVYLDGVLIAKSTPIYPNQHITGVSLLENVETGEYDVTAYLNYYDTDTKEFLSKAGYTIHLTIK